MGGTPSASHSRQPFSEGPSQETETVLNPSSAELDLSEKPHRWDIAPNPSWKSSSSAIQSSSEPWLSTGNAYREDKGAGSIPANVAYPLMVQLSRWMRETRYVPNESERKVFASHAGSAVWGILLGGVLGQICCRRMFKRVLPPVLLPGLSWAMGFALFGVPASAMMTYHRSPSVASEALTSSTALGEHARQLLRTLQESDGNTTNLDVVPKSAGTSSTSADLLHHPGSLDHKGRTSCA